MVIKFSLIWAYLYLQEKLNLIMRTFFKITIPIGYILIRKSR